MLARFPYRNNNNTKKNNSISAKRLKGDLGGCNNGRIVRRERIENNKEKETKFEGKSWELWNQEFSLSCWWSSCLAALARHHDRQITPFDGGPIGPKSTLFLRKYFSSLAKMCLPYVYLRSVETCGRILCMSSLRCDGSATSIIFWTT